MFFSDLFLSSSTNRRFLEVGSFLQLYIIIVGPSFFRQRIVVYRVVIYDIYASACNELWNTRQAREKSKSSMPEAKNTSFLRVPFQKIMYRQMHEPSWFIPLSYRGRGFVIGGLFRLKNVQVHLFFFIDIHWSSIRRKFDCLKNGSFFN